MADLKHYGIMGMRWGVRRDVGPGGRVSKKADASEDYKKSIELKARGTSALSTKELQELTNRLQLEKNYKSLTPSSYDRGMNVVKKITAAGTTIAALYGISKTPLGQDVKRTIKSKIGEKALDLAYKRAMGG